MRASSHPAACNVKHHPMINHESQNLQTRVICWNSVISPCQSSHLVENHRGSSTAVTALLQYKFQLQRHIHRTLVCASAALHSTGSLLEHLYGWGLWCCFIFHLCAWKGGFQQLIFMTTHISEISKRGEVFKIHYPACPQCFLWMLLYNLLPLQLLLFMLCLT